MTTIQDRVNTYNQLTVSAAKQWYAADGQWQMSDAVPPASRERLWLCCALFGAGEDALANAIISATEFRPWRSDWPADPAGTTSTFDIFHTNVAIVLLRKYGPRLSPSASAPLLALAREAMNIYHGDRRPDLQFHGYNDNMPAKATMGLILGGELLGNRDAVSYGVWNLRRLTDMLRRRGVISEWNSPTYTPLTVHAMAEIAAHADSEEARALALDIERRIWLDLAARFHPEIGALAGPHSRAYTVDELAYVTCASSLLWFVLGDSSRVSPLALFDERQRRELVLHHEGDVAFNVAQMAWFSTDSYHVPPLALSLFREKNYPFRAVAMAETGDGGPDYPARALRLETFMQRDYTVGTVNSTWLSGGNAQEYMVHYKVSDSAQSRRDTGVIFHKMLLNDDTPGAQLCPLKPSGEPYADGDERYHGSCGNTLALQSGPTALVLANPKPQLGGDGERTPAKPINRLSEMILFPAHFGGAEEIIVGDRRREKWAGGVTRGAWIGVRRGRLLTAIRPLAFSVDGRTPRVTLEKINNYEVIKIELYSGEFRTFKPQELRTMFGGFVAEHASVDEYPSLTAFLAELAGAKFTDYYWIMRRTRYRRPAGARPALDLEISASPGACGARYAMINGEQVTDERVSIDGVADADLPIINAPWQPVPPLFPWPHFKSPWGTGAVGDAEG